jgi:ClpP class serine protease
MRTSSTISCRCCGGGEADWIEADEYTTAPTARLRRPRIAVLYAVGTIVSGRSGFDPTDGDIVGSDTLIEDIRRIRDDHSIAHRAAHRQPGRRRWPPT